MKNIFYKGVVQLEEYAFYLAVFTLPVFIRINNFLLVAWILLCVSEILFISRKWNLKRILVFGWPILAFFVLSLLGAFRTLDFGTLKYLENDLALLFVPVLILAKAESFNERRRMAFLSLVWGTAVTLVVYIAASLYIAFKEGRWIQTLGEAENLAPKFIATLDIHPAYLALFVVTSILFLIQDKGVRKAPKYFAIAFFLLGLFQLTSKIALLLFVLFIFYVLVTTIKNNTYQKLVLAVGILFSTLVFWFFGSQYMNGTMFSVDSVLDKKRIERWEVSYQIFKEDPLFGVGFEKIDQVRKEKYSLGGYDLAEENDLNAHNQFFEYLSVNGAIGGFVYVIALGFLFLISSYTKDHLFSFIFFVFILANLTESMMVRIQGIAYFAIFASLAMASASQRTGRHNRFKLKTVG